MAHIAFNEKNYETTELTTEAKAYLEGLKITEAEIQQLSSLLKIATDAQELYTQKLTEILGKD